MLISASDEFVALCRSQVALLTQGLGASLSIVYLAEELSDLPDTKLIPVVAYPDVAATWEVDQILAILAKVAERGQANVRLLPSDSSNPNSSPIRKSSSLSALPPSKSNTSSDSYQSFIEQDSLLQQQVVLPLIHNDMVMGLLVTARSDRPWVEPERMQIERVARTLAIACVLDQRGQWLDHDLHQQRLLQAQQHDMLDDLLHQFRNPLTALRTLGKLLLRRLLPGDENRSVAEGIVRESDRLQDLLQRFDDAIDLGEAELFPLLDGGEVEMQGTTGQIRPQVTTPEASVPMLPGTNFLAGHSIHVAPHQVADVLKPLLDSAMAIAQDRQLTLRIHIPTQLPPVMVDDRALREVFSNLIDNALKYTPSPGAVFVWVERHEATHPSPMQSSSTQVSSTQNIVIADTGPGIPPQDLEHLFERHYRGVQAVTDIPGTGLGLAIARDLVHQMRGKIQVFSPASTSGLLNGAIDPSDTFERPGTAFVICFPEATDA